MLRLPLASRRRQRRRVGSSRGAGASPHRMASRGRRLLCCRDRRPGARPTRSSVSASNASIAAMPPAGTKVVHAGPARCPGRRRACWRSEAASRVSSVPSVRGATPARSAQAPRRRAASAGSQPRKAQAPVDHIPSFCGRAMQERDHASEMANGSVSTVKCEAAARCVHRQPCTHRRGLSKPDGQQRTAPGWGGASVRRCSVLGCRRRGRFRTLSGWPRLGRTFGCGSRFRFPS